MLLLILTSNYWSVNGETKKEETVEILKRPCENYQSRLFPGSHVTAQSWRTAGYVEFSIMERKRIPDNCTDGLVQPSVLGHQLDTPEPRVWVPSPEWKHYKPGIISWESGAHTAANGKKASA